jgi:hypothetical protein
MQQSLARKSADVINHKARVYCRDPDGRDGEPAARDCLTKSKKMEKTLMRTSVSPESLTLLFSGVISCCQLLMAQDTALPPRIIGAGGATLTAGFTVLKENGQQKIVLTIPDSHGKTRSAGYIPMESRNVNFGKSHIPRYQTVLMDTNVWTPRLETLNSLDLASEKKVIEQPGFDFEEFTNHPAVIKFGNGYAVNLFGAIAHAPEPIAAAQEGDVAAPLASPQELTLLVNYVPRRLQIVGLGKGAYLSSSGKKLLPRLVTRVDVTKVSIRPGDRVRTVGEAALMDADKTRTMVPAHTELVATDVRDPWVGVSVEQDRAIITGWIERRYLTVPGKEFEERILKETQEPHQK